MIRRFFNATAQITMGDWWDFAAALYVVMVILCGWGVL